MRKKQFFKKLFWSFLFLTVLYTFISVGIFLVKNQEILEYRTETSQKSFLESSSKTIDTTLKVGLNWIYQMRFNEYVADFAETEERDYYAITQIYNELNRMGAVFSDFGYIIGITQPNNELVITQSRTLSKENFLKSLNMSSNDIDTFRGMEQMEWKYKQSDTAYFESDSYFTIIRNEEIGNGNIVSFYLSFSKETFFPKTSEKEGFGIFYGDQLIATNQSDVSISDILTDDAVAQLREKNKYSPVYAVQPSKNHKAHMIRSDVLKNLYYVYLTPSSEITPSNQNIGFFTIGFILVALLLGGLLAFFAANRTYRPIQRLFNVFQENSESEWNSELKDELKYMEENYIAIKNNNDKLRKLVQNNGKTLKNTYLKNVMHGLLTEPSIEEGIKKYDLYFLNKPLRAVLIEFENFSEIEGEFSSETIHLLKSQLLRNLHSELSAKLNLAIFELDYHRFGIIVEDEEIGLIKKTLQTAFANIEQHSNITLIGTIGGVAEKHIDLKKSYIDAMKMLEYRFALPESSIITLETIYNIKDTSFTYPLDTERDLISYVVQGDGEKALKVLDELLSENLRNKYIKRESARQFTNAIISTIHRILHLINEEPDTIFEQNNLTDLMLSENNDMLIQNIKKYIEEIIKYINKSKNAMEQQKKDIMLNFIHSNYQEDLSLFSLAEYLNLSTGYISTLFKKYTGENFKDYLNIYRVKVAKELLATKKFKINEVSEKVGYNNTNSFIRIFKKYEGISPGKYMNHF